jgi:hypothetical protein
MFSLNFGALADGLFQTEQILEVFEVQEVIIVGHY